MTAGISIATDSDLPIYRQIYHQIRRNVLIGELKEGELLPSVRALAERLVVNPNTVARAYQELARDGVVDSQQGRGIFVARVKCVLSEEERLRRCRIALDLFLEEAAFLDFTPEEIRPLLERSWRRFKKQEGK